MKTKNAFSLIELSIVLIIIGLLVAGITGGASLIKSAELRSLMSEIRNYQTAVNAYYTATGELPGTGGASSMDFVKSCLAWAKLADEGIIDAKPSSITGSAGSFTCVDLSDTKTFANTNSPESKLKGGLYALGYNTDMGENVIFIVASGEKPATLTAAKNTDTVAKTTVSSVSRKDAKFLDEKMDNGVIDSGKIYSFSGGTATCAYDNTTAKDCSTAVAIGL